MLMMTRREDFVRANRHAYVVRVAGFVLQAVQNHQTDPRFGFTATRKLGKAVLRNRVKRRLRALVRCHLQQKHVLFQGGLDYVLIAKASTVHRPYAKLEKDLIYALHQVNRHFPSDTAGKGAKKPL